ncbi:hypothetical protein K438DRAFT_1771623 [Mycena galopus ATCC 62051]|nr:hypothetical protein K438DRAFT_1771623 [Mycena galopus ATCC 62051]
MTSLVPVSCSAIQPPPFKASPPPLTQLPSTLLLSLHLPQPLPQCSPRTLPVPEQTASPPKGNRECAEQCAAEDADYNYVLQLSQEDTVSPEQQKNHDKQHWMVQEQEPVVDDLEQLAHKKIGIIIHPHHQYNMCTDIKAEGHSNIPDQGISWDSKGNIVDLSAAIVHHITETRQVPLAGNQGNMHMPSSFGSRNAPMVESSNPMKSGHEAAANGVAVKEGSPPSDPSSEVYNSEGL